MRLRTIGVSGSAPGPDSPASCYLLQVPAATVTAGKRAGTVPAEVAERDWNVVVDLGNGGLGVLQRHVQADDLDLVALSHMHADHCADLSALYVHRKYHPTNGAAYTGESGRLTVWGPSDVAAKVQLLTGDVGGAAEMFDLRTWRFGEPVRVGPLEILPFPVFHSVEAYGMRITGPSTREGGQARVLAYTGDTDYCENAVKLARDADLLLSEAAFVEGRDDVIAPGVHLTGKRAGQIATEAGAARLLLTHIPAWNDPAITLAEARAAYAGPVRLAEPDGVEVL